MLILLILRDLVKDSLPLKKRKKPWLKVDSNSGPLNYETVPLTTSPPTLTRLVGNWYKAVQGAANLKVPDRGCHKEAKP